MKTLALGVCLAGLAVPTIDTACATSPHDAAPSTQQYILELSRQKWAWMADRNVAELDALFDDQAVFVHMGGTMTKEAELDVIRNGAIQYKQAEIKESSFRLIGSKAIVLNRIRLTAVVGGSEVVNPFMVTEVYVREKDTWKLASLSFTRLLSD